MTHSPDSSWVLQDLDMYPQDRVPSGYPIKAEVTMDSGEYGAVSAPGALRSQSCALASSSYPGLAAGGLTAAAQYNGVPGYGHGFASVPQQQGNNSGDWPSDLDNILMGTPLPSDCDSPLKLEEYNMEFVYVNPSTLDQSSSATSVPSATSLASSTATASSIVRPPFNNANCPPCSQMNYNSSPSCAAPLSAKPLGLQGPPYGPVTAYPGPAESAVHPEMGPGACVPDQARIVGSRGRPRNEWRITGRPKDRKGCVGRPRSKPGRVGRPLGVKTEPFDMSDSMSLSDPTEEKRERRREQNRRAARKLREKKKVNVENMKKDYEGIIQANRRLTKEVDSLRSEVQMLRMARDNHVCSCRDSFTPSPASSVSRPASSYGNAAPHLEHADITSFCHAD